MEACSTWVSAEIHLPELCGVGVGEVPAPKVAAFAAAGGAQALLVEGEGEDFAGGDVAHVVGLGKLGDGELAVGKGDRGLGPCAAERGALAKEEAQVLNRLGFAVDGVGGVEQRGELYDRRQERAVGIRAKAERADAGYFLSCRFS